MSPSRKAKKAGFRGITDIMRITGMSSHELSRMDRDNPKLFAIVLAGCVAIQSKEES